MRHILVLFLVALFSVFSVLGVQAMGSSNYQIPWDSVNTGGDESSASPNYQVYDTIGQLSVGASSSTEYRLESGYRTRADLLRISFTVNGQSSTFASRYTRFDSSSPDYVVVSSTNGLVNGDYIAAVQNVGYSALVAIGKVIGIAGDIVTVDDWQGDAIFMDGFSSDSDDFIYKINARTIPLGSVSADAGGGSIALAGGSIISSATNGYSVYVQADSPLTRVEDGITEIASVEDGMISGDSEEYGAEAIGLYVLDPWTDIAVTTTQRSILSSTIPSMTPADRFILLFKLAVTGDTTAGEYRQTVFFTLTPNF